MKNRSLENLWIEKGGIVAALMAVLFVSALPGIMPAIAAEQQQKALPEIDILKDQNVSIADFHEVPITEASGNVYIITDEDIQNSGATDIPTLLRSIPGIEVMQMTAADYNVSVRGNNQTAANRLLVLIDGRSIYEDIYSGVFWTLLPVTLPEIKRIEILKGPASALYGFNAFDGVINIITKSPAEMKGSTNGTLLQFGGGEFGTITSSAIQAGTYDKLGYRLSVGHDQANKWSDRNALALRTNKFNLQTEYALGDLSKVMLSGGIVDGNHFDGQDFDFIHEAASITNGYIQGEYRRADFFIRAYWNRWHDSRQEIVQPSLAGLATSTDRDGNSNQVLSEDSYNVETQNALELGPTNRLTYGVNYRYNAASLNVLDQFRTENRLGIYFQDEWRATRTVTVVAGLRYDMHSEINPTYSPRVSVLFQPVQDHTFRVASGIAYRPPTIFESHANLLTNIIPFGVSITTVGSQNLDAEKITSVDAGYQGWYLKHRLRLRADVFYNHIEHFITGAPTSNPLVATLANMGKVDSWGGETGVEFLATTWLTGFANYSFVNIWQSTDLQAGAFARGAPANKFNVGLRGEWANGLSGEAVLNHVAAASYPVSGAFPFFAGFGFPVTVPDTRVGSYNLLNLRGAYKFWHEKAEVAVSAFNALNDHHKENPVGDTISSRVMGWLTIRY